MIPLLQLRHSTTSTVFSSTISNSATLTFEGSVTWSKRYRLCLNVYKVIIEGSLTSGNNVDTVSNLLYLGILTVDGNIFTGGSPAVDFLSGVDSQLVVCRGNLIGSNIANTFAGGGESFVVVLGSLIPGSQDWFSASAATDGTIVVPDGGGGGSSGMPLIGGGGLVY